MDDARGPQESDGSHRSGSMGPPSWRLPVRVLIVALVGSFLLGGATSFAQTYLPDDLRPFANSVSGWTILTVLLLWSLPVGPVTSAVLGAASFVLLTVGYAVVSSARGFYYDPTLWSMVGLVAGPFVGGAVWLAKQPRPLLAAAGAGFIGGILIGDAVHGYVTVRDTTGSFYWVALAAGTILWLAWFGIRRIRGVRWVALMGAVSALSGAALFLALRLVFGDA